ncbi:MAG: hypothetical protein LBL35_05500, partial [Clostridiales bacterium]|nr:hypothetical protein [Clostridiales bacterium]
MTKAGKVYEISGGTEAVDISALGKKLECTFVTHNHPVKATELSFSNDDYDEFISRSLGAPRGVDYKYSYELTAFKASNKKYLSQIISAP